MRAHILITNGGEHPPALWAEKAAEILVDRMIQFDRAPTAEERKAQKLLEVQIQDALEPHFQKVQSAEADKLKKNGDEHLLAPYDPTTFLNAATASVVACTKGTIFEPHFAKEEVQKFISAQLGQLFASTQHVRRSWHNDRLCKRDPGNRHAREFTRRWRNPEPAEG